MPPNAVLLLLLGLVVLAHGQGRLHNSTADGPSSGRGRRLAQADRGRPANESRLLREHDEGPSVAIGNASAPTRCDLLARSAKALPNACSAQALLARSAQASSPLPLLVTGIGRSGTTFVQQLLAKVGLRVSHDDRNSATCPCPGQDGVVSWAHAFHHGPVTVRGGRRAHDTTTSCPRPRWSYPLNGHRFRVVVHLVRDPLKTIASRANLRPRSLVWYGDMVRAVPCLWTGPAYHPFVPG